MECLVQQLWFVSSAVSVTVAFDSRHYLRQFRERFMRLHSLSLELHTMIIFH